MKSQGLRPDPDPRVSIARSTPVVPVFPANRARGCGACWLWARGVQSLHAGCSVTPPILHDLPVAAEVRAEDDQLKTLGPRLEGAHGRWRDADGVQA